MVNIDHIDSSNVNDDAELSKPLEILKSSRENENHDLETKAKAHMLPSSQQSQCQNHKKINIQRIKRLLLIFLKQFDVDEYAFLIKFLDLMLIKYQNDPAKIFVYLTEREYNRRSLNADKNDCLKDLLSSYVETKTGPMIEDLVKCVERENGFSHEDEDITYLDEYQSDIIASFAMKEHEEEANTSILDTSAVKQENEDVEPDFIDDYNFYYYNQEENRSSDEDAAEFEEEGCLRQQVANSKPKNGKGRPHTVFDAKMRVRKFSDSIRSELERKFVTNHFISGAEKAQLAVKLNLTERQVQKWFVHRREKLRRNGRAGEQDLDADQSNVNASKYGSESDFGERNELDAKDSSSTKSDGKFKASEGKWRK